MARSATTVRLHAEERLALEHLSRSQGRSLSQLLNDAVRFYLTRTGKRERHLEDTMSRLRAYRERDPDFQAAIASYAETEVKLHDPLEDTVIHKTHDTAGPTVSTGPVQTRIHHLLRA